MNKQTNSFIFRILLPLVFLIFSTYSSKAQQYTENFNTAPTLIEYPGVPSWKQIAEVTIGGVVYQIINGGNGGWAYSGSGGESNSPSIVYTTAATTSVTIKRKDGLQFAFYGVWLKYTNYTNVGYSAPWLTESYTSNPANPTNQTYPANSTVILTKSPAVIATSVNLNFSGLNSLNFDKLTVGPAIALPLTLLSFGAVARGNDVQLTWKTTAEINVDKFEVETSEDGTMFSKFGEEVARGNNTVTTSYSFTHLHPSSSYNYYRLKMIDKDGNYEYSKVISVNIGTTQNPTVKIITNPIIANNLKIKLINLQPGQYNLTIMDMKGVVVFKQRVQNPGGLTSLNLQLPFLSQGLYNVQIRNQGALFNQKVTVN